MGKNQEKSLKLSGETITNKYGLDNAVENILHRSVDVKALRQTIEAKGSTSLHILSNWLSLWNRKLNVTKTKVLTISKLHISYLVLIFNSIDLSEIDSYKFRSYISSNLIMASSDFVD